ncbi:hypothetical protein EDD11_000812 [Mortierella claussenii]|nr:hypothetical protein EDD11_000812 [Mortierella claussenii]
MAMAMSQADAFSSPNLSTVEEILQSSSRATGLSRTGSNGMGHGSSSTQSSSSSTSSEDVAGRAREEVEDGSMLARLLSNRDLFPMILGHLETRSLLSLTSINARFRREILMPATPNLCCLNQFLQYRTVVCPMAQFETLKDFMVKYRSFKPLHLHFTYSDRSSLMSLVPEVTAPIYNSKQDTTFSHPSSSPLTTSHLFGVNQSISINITSANSLYQHHHPLTQDQQQLQQVPLQHTQHENDQPESISSYASSSTSSNTSSNTVHMTNHFPNNINITHTPITPTTITTTASNNTQHAAIERLKTMRTDSSSSTDSAISDGFESEIRSTIEGGTVSSHGIRDKSQDLESKIAAMTISPALDLQQQQQQQQYTSRSVDYYSNGSSNHHPTLNNSHHYFHHQHSGMVDGHLASRQSESIPVHSSSAMTVMASPQLSGESYTRGSHSHHGFELSYWQKFALNELFMRLLPFIKTLTIGRTDKPSREARTRAQTQAQAQSQAQGEQQPQHDVGRSVNGELSAGVCFFLARCFNVMHDMPDTALESVIWMDVTVKDVALLVTMIELRDIMVDERYWKRGYWASDRPSTRAEQQLGGGRAGGQRVNSGRNRYGIQVEDEEDDEEEDEDDWDGFYYLINQEGGSAAIAAAAAASEKRAATGSHQSSSYKKSNSPYSSSAAGKTPLRKSSNLRGSSSSASIPSSSSSVGASSQFSKQTIAPLPSQQQVSGLGHLVKNASSSSSLSGRATAAGSSSTSSLATTASTLTSFAINNNDQSSRSAAIPPPAAWQGFGDGVPTASTSDVNVLGAFFAEEKLHPAVQLYQALKAEIVEAAFVSRTLDKGKQLALSSSTTTPSTGMTPITDMTEPWPYEDESLARARMTGSASVSMAIGTPAVAVTRRF